MTMEILSILNPTPTTKSSKSHRGDLRNLSSPPVLRPSDLTNRPSLPPSKKQKLSKDAPVFEKGPIRGVVHFPPTHILDAAFVRELERFQIYPPLEEIADYRKHIPYNSDKKGFREKTGRVGFDVYQYTFKLPPELKHAVDDAHKEKPWTIMWDYHVGLVRMTALFRALGHPKTIPKKAIDANNLEPYAYNVTGGSIPAQGYWIPFNAAKAIAATFCYNIRYALTPVFGTDFPKLCETTQVRSSLGVGDARKFVIDPLIVSACKEEVERRAGTSRVTPSIGTASSSSSPDLATSSFTRQGSLSPRSQTPSSGQSGWNAINKVTDRPELQSRSTQDCREASDLSENWSQQEWEAAQTLIQLSDSQGVVSRA